MSSLQENINCQNFIEEEKPTLESLDIVIDQYEDTDDQEILFINENTDTNNERRKSVENIVCASQDVIGTSISQAIAFTSAMILPGGSPTSGSESADQQSVNRLNTQSPSPQGSPKSSPKLHRRGVSSSQSPTPLPDQLNEYCDSIRSDSSNLLDVNNSNSPDGYNSKEGSVERKDGSDSKLDRCDKPEKKKKKSSWYNVLYPTYKSRNEDFKRIFKDVPDDERLIVDYSCALQKEILVHGRLYISQNYLCFYANIFGWETTVCLKWREVTGITKEKTALVIPNAILVLTRSEKMFFTSFGARDKTYLMLFRVWQNVLLDKQMSQQEMWKWVHSCYGDELGLTSDDEDYIAPNTEVYKILTNQKLSVESNLDEPPSPLDLNPSILSSTFIPIMDQSPLRQLSHQESFDRRGNSPEPFDTLGVSSQTDTLPTDLSDTTESDIERSERAPSVASQLSPIECSSIHEGRQIVRTSIAMHIDTLFTLLFTSSKFLLDHHVSRGTTDYNPSPWTQNSKTGEKLRTITLTVCTNATVGPKTAFVTETQTMLPCSRPGQMYSIDVESVNSNIPYADSFYVTLHFCLSYMGDNETLYEVFAQVKYRKSVWGLVKGMIEKNCWSGLQEFYQSLVKALENECEEMTRGILKRKIKRLRRRGVPTVSQTEMFNNYKVRPTIITTNPSDVGLAGSNRTDYTTILMFGVLIMLVFLNVMLYMKLWTLEDESPISYKLLDLQALKEPPKSHEEWLKLLQQQEQLHALEMQKWQRVLRAAVHLLRKAEDSLSELQLAIRTQTYNVATPSSDEKNIEL